MQTDSREFKDSVLAKLLAPNNVGVPQLAVKWTLQRWRRDGAISGDARTREHRADGAVRSPANRLSQAEQAAVLAVANAPRFASWRRAAAAKVML